MSGRRNPYIGARPFERKKEEILFGREREVRELAALLIAERIALLYSPSGAGKTSLIQARLLDEMEKEGFEALPVIRVSMEVCPEDRESLADLAVNRYLLSAMLSLEETVPAQDQIPLRGLAGMSFDDYLTRRTAALPPDRSPLLIFDQFEEILTLDPTDQAAKEAFFDDVGDALRNRDRWALFSMREDYVGSLEAYLRRLPTRLRTTFRLDLLDVAAAQQAIRKPAESAGVKFHEKAAAALIDNLRAVWVQRSDGSRERQLGPYIEPVQLQVVCRRLWDRLPDDASEIRVEDVAALGDVDAALAGYYADRVAAIAASTGVSERKLREWVDTQLITEQRMRGQVLLTQEKSQGLDNRAIRELVGAHLVREERRRGATWLELAHDRLIDPVKADNAEWQRTHLNEFQRHAALWAAEGRSERLLLYGRAVEVAEAWAREHEEELTETERDFLAACRKAREEALKEEERRWTATRLTEVEREKSRFRWLAFFAATLALFAFGMAVFAYWQKARAEEATEAETAARKELEKSVSEKDAALTQLRQKTAELEFRTAQLVKEYQEKVISREQIAVARREAQEIATQENALVGGNPIRIQYFAKNHDEKLISLLEERGFPVKRFAGGFDVVNRIWYARDISEEELRLIALTLLEAGAKVQYVAPFNNRQRSRVVSIGADPNWLAAPPYTVERIKVLSLGSTTRLQPIENLPAPPTAYEPPR